MSTTNSQFNTGALPSDTPPPYSTGAGGVTTPTTATGSSNTQSSTPDPMAKYYRSFYQFIPDSALLARQQLATQSPGGTRINKAQQKLLGLSKNQFQELATDVYDEMQRRIRTASVTSPLSEEEDGFLKEEKEFHPKRNHARKKLSLLPDLRFTDLVYDIWFEIERRNPELAMGKAQPQVQVQDKTSPSQIEPSYVQQKQELGQGLDETGPRTVGQNGSSKKPGLKELQIPRDRHSPEDILSPPLQTSMLTPVKSTLVEDSDDNDDEADHKISPTAQAIDSPIAASLAPPDIKMASPETPSEEQIRSMGLANGLTQNGNNYDDEDDEEDDDTDFKNPHAHPIDVPRTWTPTPPPGSLSENLNSAQGRALTGMTADSMGSENLEFNDGQNMNGLMKKDSDMHLSSPLSENPVFDAQIKDKDEQIQLLLEEGTRMDETITKLEQQLNESEALKDTLVDENGRLHQMIGESENSKEAAMKEIDVLRQEIKSQLQQYQLEMQTKQQDITQLETQNRQLQDQLDQALTDQQKQLKSPTSPSAQSQSAAAALNMLEPLQNRILALEESLVEKNKVIEGLKSSQSSGTGLGIGSAVAATGAAVGAAVVAGTRSNANNTHEDTSREIQPQIAGSTTNKLYSEATDPNLQENYDALKHELEEQRELNDRIRSEAAAFLAEMRELAEHPVSEEAEQEIELLRKEVNELKFRTGDTVKWERTNGWPEIYVDENGVLSKVLMENFRKALDQVLVALRDPGLDLIDCLHEVVVSVRNIKEAVKMSSSEEVIEASTTISATTNQLINSARVYKDTRGLTSRLLVNSAATDLSSAVMELAKLVKLEPGSEDLGIELEEPTTSSLDRHQELTLPNRYGSYIKDPSHTLKFDMSNPADNTVIELQEYLENETAGVIDSIQDLLTGIKGTSTYHSLRANITNITDSVRAMISATSGMMQQSKHWQLKEHGTYIVDSLENCVQRMKVLYGDSQAYDGGQIPDKQFKQRLAGISFDMAKCTTELVKTVEEVNLKLEIDQIDEKLK